MGQSSLRNRPPIKNPKSPISIHQSPPTTHRSLISDPRSQHDPVNAQPLFLGFGLLIRLSIPPSPTIFLPVSETFLLSKSVSLRQIPLQLSYRTGRGDMVTGLDLQCLKSSPGHEQL